MLDHPTPPKVPHVVPEMCRMCKRCPARDACRVKAIIRIDRGEPPYVDASLCYGCLVCVPACPFGAIVA